MVHFCSMFNLQHTPISHGAQRSTFSFYNKSRRLYCPDSCAPRADCWFQKHYKRNLINVQDIEAVLLLTLVFWWDSTFAACDFFLSHSIACYMRGLAACVSWVGPVLFPYTHPVCIPDTAGCWLDLEILTICCCCCFCINLKYIILFQIQFWSKLIVMRLISLHLCTCAYCNAQRLNWRLCYTKNHWWLLRNYVNKLWIKGQVDTCFKKMLSLNTSKW